MEQSPKWLLISDVDGTLTTEVSVWEYLHKQLGKWDSEGFPNLNAYLCGEIDYAEFAARDASAYKGLSRGEINELMAAIPRRQGMEDMLRTLQRRGFCIALISTGLDILVNQIPYADERIANRLVFQNDICTGQVEVVIPIGGKGSVTRDLITRLGFDRDYIVALGDTNGDLPMMERAGFSVAVAAQSSEILQKASADSDGADLMRLPALIEEYRESIESRRTRRRHRPSQPVDRPPSG